MSFELPTYKGSVRNYTVFGISPVFKAIVDKKFIDFFGGQSLSHLYFVVRKGVFYHFQIDAEVDKLMEIFLGRVNRNEIDLFDVYETYNRDVSKLESIYMLKPDQYDLKTLTEFYQLYSSFIHVAYSSFYSADFVSKCIKDKALASKYLEWISQIRSRGENIYKEGENVFIPAYSEWLAARFPGSYTAEQIMYLTHQEISDWVKGASKVSKEDLDDRKRIFFGDFQPVGKEEYLQSAEAEKKIDELGLFHELDAEVGDVTELKGQIAFKGRVSGRVRLIFSREDMSKFKTGEIIVSPMTEPGYIPIMKLASAFVTDEGGMLCHAAIVAREMCKPCVISTKIATKIFKDGDLIEVDAENGIVRKLSK